MLGVDISIWANVWINKFNDYFSDMKNISFDKMTTISGGLTGGDCFFSGPLAIGGSALSALPGFGLLGSAISVYAQGVFKYCLKN